MPENPSNPSVQHPDLETLWNPSNPSASEAALQGLLPGAYHLIGGDRGHLIDVLVQIARAQTLQKKISEARLSLEEAEKLLSEPWAAPLVSQRIRWLLERGRLFILERTPSQARAAFVEAWPLAEKSGEDYSLVEIAQLMAAIEPQKSQQDWINKAIQVAERSKQPAAKQRLGNLYASLGWKLYDLRQFEKSLGIFQKSLEHSRLHGTERDIFIARWSSGKVLRAMGKTEAALEIQKTLLAELTLSGTHDGRLYEEIAECLQTLHKEAEAQPYFEMAYQELSHDEWVADNQPVKLKRMKELGKVKDKR